MVVHETRSLDPDDHVFLDGIPCTSVARTLVDLAAVVASQELLRILEQAVRLERFDRKALERYSGRRGMARLRRLIAQLADDPPLLRSELERLLLDLIRAANLPMPVVNGRIGDHEVDFHWPGHHLVLETDGAAFHDDPIASRRDRRRDLDLELAGWHVLRIGWREVVDEPQRVVALLRACLTTA